jgi:hypothetical protein
VLGELTGGSNAFGVTGLAPSAPLRTVNVSSLNANGVCAYNLANAIKVASDNASAGDVILIEQQAAGPRWNGDPNSQVGDVPVEWDQSVAVWTAIHDATSLGRIVIEAGGNGSQNLDDPIYNDAAGTNWFSHDSGAIIVGAGNAPGCTTRGNVPARSRLYFSDYGSRLDLQGWGACVVTTGYGDLQGGTDPNLWYTQDFSGTSSASPIVASSAAVMSSLAKSRGSLLTPATVRSMLKSTGQRQASGEPGNIGPLPNLKTAINALGPKVVETAHVVSGTNLGATSVPVRETWTSSGSAAAQYEVWLYTDGGSPVKQSSQAAPATLLQLERGHKYQFAIRAADAAGIWGDWMVGKKFEVGEYQENYSATYLAYAGNWTRSSWAPASEGNVTVSSTPGDRATFSFTGSNVAWIATKSSNRGQANVYIDGSFVATVDLYSSTTTSAQAIAYTYAWPAVASHTIAVEVVGTAGHPKVDVDAFVRLK